MDEQTNESPCVLLAAAVRTNNGEKKSNKEKDLS